MANMLVPRFDRMASLYLVSPLRRSLWPREKGRIPILMYHSISDSCEKRLHSYYETNTSPRIFAAHMQYLYENQYSIITLAEVKKYLAPNQKTLGRCIAITFDDGYRDFYTEAFPILEKYGFTATMFLPTNFISNQRMKFKEMECLTWKEVRELHRQGIVFGSHTVTHPQLRFLKRVDIESEIERSKATIEFKLGASIESFSYPFAFPEEDNDFKSSLREILKKYGYKNGVCTNIGRATEKDDVFFLRRIPVNAWDDLPLFKAKLEGDYDWINKLQYASKSIKSRILRWLSRKT